ncbi:hypothetical protein SUGI_0728070 [Cryptomeria japonica]|nr:hypothetical protein SUGI_0728070 [Cryptomeria japonica]
MFFTLHETITRYNLWNSTIIKYQCYPNQTFQQTILYDQQNSGQHRLPFRIDLNQTPGTVDAIEIEDGFDDIAMAHHDQHYYK